MGSACRLMATRSCPPAGCGALCARFESDDEGPWLARYATGGVVRPPAEPGDDQVPVFLSPGHAWVSAEAARLYGEPFLRKLLEQRPPVRVTWRQRLTLWRHWTGDGLWLTIAGICAAIGVGLVGYLLLR